MPRQSKPCNRGLVGLIGQQEKKLNNLYNSTAREISVILTKYKLKSKRDVWLGNANAQKEVDAAMNRFQSKLLGSIKGDMGSSWGMADDCADGVVNDYLKNINIPDDVRNAMLYQNASAFDAFVNRRRNGLNLSDRVWKITKDTKKQFEQLLGSGVMDGRSAQGMATDLRRYLKEPNKQFRRVRNEFGKLVLSNPAKDYHPGQGVYRSSYQNALRLARNEVNLSYRHNEHLRRQNMPFVTGIRVNLSGSHPTRDICDDMQGDYPKTFRFGGWHPTCICFTTSILLDKKEFVEYAKTGKIDASRNITKIPDNASKYLKENADTFANYKNPPYFLKDNFDFKNGDYTFHNRNQIILDAKNAGIDTEKVFMRDGVYTPERQILHDEIIQKFMSESKVRGTNKKYMLGGAPANGKSALVDSGFLPHPKNILTVDSDAIKGLIPEYQTMLANGDSAAAAFVHEESSYLAKRILAQAEKLGDDFVLDGVNDGSIEKLLKKIEGYKKGGSRLRADYVSLDTKLSKDLAKARYEKTGRYVPDEIVAGNNIEVSKLVPEILNRNAIDEFYLWDTNIKDKARLILKQIDGELTMYDEKLYKRFLRKAGKQHADDIMAKYATEKAAQKAAQKEVAKLARAEKAGKRALAKVEKEAAEREIAKKAAQEAAARAEIEAAEKAAREAEVKAYKAAKEIKFKPAKTIKEAEEFARKNKLAAEVDYTGASLEQANAINEGIVKVRNLVYDDIMKIDKLVMDFEMAETARAEAGTVRFNPRIFGKFQTNQAESIAKLEKRLARQREFSKQYGISESDKKVILDKIDGLELRLEQLKKAPEYVVESPVEVVMHEMGHVVQDNLSRINRFTNKLIQYSGDREKVGIKWNETLLSKLDDIAYKDGIKISHYATTNAEEYFAESWVHYIKGLDENFIDRELLEIFQKVTIVPIEAVPTALEKTQIARLMKLAAESGDEVQSLAEKIAKDFGGYTTPLNLKGKGSILTKLRNDYQGDISRMADAVRTTIIVEEKNIDKILKLLGKNSNFTRIKRQLPKDYQGYSGSITNLKTSKGILGEIQVNTERMIYAKEKPADAQRILGLKRWREIEKETGLPGGLGHIYYEQYRILHDEIEAQKRIMEKLKELSTQYYKFFQ